MLLARTGSSVPAIDQGAAKNRLLTALPPDAFALIAPHLQLVPTSLHQVLIAPDVEIEHLFFPETGFASITTVGSSSKVEVGMIGREGLVGAAPVLLGGDRSPYEHYVQSSGEAYSIRRSDLMAAVDRSPAMRDLLMRFVQTLFVQTGQTAFVNATFDLEARLARWLLMCQDRLGGEEIVLTHEFLSIMLGVQRSSVTLTLQTLEGSLLIRARRGRIEIRDREKLEAVADAGYGVPEAEYARLIDGG